jgi:hypothetical protein
VARIAGRIAGGGSTTTPLDPGLAALGDYGGPTKTHRLLSTSRAIDAGTNAKALDAAGDPLVFDQRGLERFIDWDEDLDERIDVGAYELAIAEMYSYTLIPERKLPNMLLAVSEREHKVSVPHPLR